MLDCTATALSSIYHCIFSRVEKHLAFSLSIFFKQKNTPTNQPCLKGAQWVDRHLSVRSVIQYLLPPTARRETGSLPTVLGVNKPGAAAVCSACKWASATLCTVQTKSLGVLCWARVFISSSDSISVQWLSSCCLYFYINHGDCNMHSCNRIQIAFCFQS